MLTRTDWLIEASTKTTGSMAMVVQALEAR